MKKFMCAVLTAVTLVLSLNFPAFALSQSSKNIFSAKTPTASSQAELKFSKRLGQGYQNAPTPPLVVGDYLIVLSAKSIYKLNRLSGSVVAKGEMVQTQGYSCVMPAYANGCVYVQLGSGTVQAFDFSTLSSLWVYRDSLGGQALTPITYDNGYIYTGFWNGEEKYASFVCLSVKDENKSSTHEAKKAVWTHKHKGGYYLSGAVITKKFAVLGCDNGKNDSLSNSKILCFDKLTGKLVSSAAVKGDVRSSVKYASSQNAYYVSTKAGYVYKFSLNSSSGKITSLVGLKVGSAVTSTPVINENRLYVGVSEGSGGSLAVINAKTMKLIYRASADGYPQGAVSLSTAHEKDSGKLYVYFTCNCLPGALYVLEDAKGQKKGEVKALYTPASGSQNYSISPVSVASDGTLYYKNDSGYIFAVGRKTESSGLSFVEILTQFMKIFAIIKRMLGL